MTRRRSPNFRWFALGLAVVSVLGAACSAGPAPTVAPLVATPRPISFDLAPSVTFQPLVQPTPSPTATPRPTPSMSWSGQALHDLAVRAMAVGSTLPTGNRIKTDRRMIRQYAKILGEFAVLNSFGCSELRADLFTYISAQHTVVLIDLERARAGDFSSLTSSELAVIDQALAAGDQLQGSLQEVC